MDRIDANTTADAEASEIGLGPSAAGETAALSASSVADGLAAAGAFSSDDVPSAEAAPAVAFVTLGCAKNEVDTANMTIDVRTAGYRVVEDPAEADVVIVNTCSFIQAATEESIDAIFEVSGLDNFQRGDAKLVVAGCMPARYGEELSDELTEAAAFVPCSREDDIAEVIAATLGRPAPRDAEEMAADDGSEASGGASPDDEAGEVFAGNPATYVKIADGCDRFCSFCAIPYIRGRYHSFSYERIREDVELRVQAGAREVTLIAQDTGRWGSDLGEGRDTAWLLDHLAGEFPQTWFRLMYIEPDGVTDALLDVVANRPNVCSYLDIPLQHVNPRVLKAMHRHGSPGEFSALVDHIRAKVPGIALRTTLIAGFPGETDDEAAELLDFLDEVQLDYVGVFTYSREEGTRAAELPDQVDEDVKVARAQQIRDLCDGIGADRVARRIGQELDVLVLGCEEDGALYGRAMCQAPDVDGVVYINRGEPGEIVRVRIQDTLMYEMEGDVIDG